MITSWDIYWITRLDGLTGLFLAIAIILFTAAFICLPMGDVGKGEIFYYKKWIIGLFCAGFIFYILYIFTPSTRSFAAIYLIPKIVNNEQIQKLPDNAATLLNAKMEQWIDDTMVSKKGKM